MKYKRKKSSLSKYASSVEKRKKRKVSPFKKSVVTFFAVIFIVVTLFNMGIIKIKNRDTAEFLNEKINAVSSHIDEKIPFLSKIGRKGAEFCFGYLRKIPDSKQNVYADEASSGEAVVSTSTEPEANSCLGEDMQLQSDAEPVFEPCFPCEGRISSPFGKRQHPISGQGDFHNGIDIAAPLGTEIKAIESGVIEKCEYNQYSGNFVVIRHNDSTTSSYAHMATADVSVGQEVSKGDIIGIVGSTGSSTGPHLHMEIRIDKNAVNPMEYLAGDMNKS